ncbi:HTH domain-containing protein [Streptomyces sp. NPDC007264]|uniref:HTH domain-containing protein n=1 Tax=Streptomyces sp. NPDC007264 TaxID=3364777 RepID=UPI0036D9876C
MTLSTIPERPVRPKRPLKAEYQDALVTGEHGYASRNEAVMAVTMAMVNAGWDEADFRYEMSDPERNRLAHWFYYRSGDQAHRRRSHSDTLSRLDKTWAKAVARVRVNPAISDPQAALQEVGEIRATFRARPLQGRTAVVDSLVLEFYHQEATRRRRVRVYLPVRTIAEKVGVSRATAARAVKRLAEAGWLVETQRRELVSHANEYRLTVPPAAQAVLHSETQGRSPSTGREDCVSSRNRPLHQAMHTSGEDIFLLLGKHCALLYASLKDQRMTVRQLAESTGVHRTTAWRHLKNLRGLGLAAEADGLWTRTDKRLGDAAKEAGAVGMKEQRRFRHELEKAHWLSIVERVQFKADEKRFDRTTAVRNAIERGARKPEPAHAELVDIATGEIYTAAPEAQVATQEGQEPATVVPLPRARSEARSAQLRAAMAA